MEKLQTFPFDLSIQEKLSSLVGKRRSPFISAATFAPQPPKYFVAVTVTRTNYFWFGQWRISFCTA
jgi:hypothetical protein